jgi:hypothetical protein
MAPIASAVRAERNSRRGVLGASQIFPYEILLTGNASDSQIGKHYTPGSILRSMNGNTFLSSFPGFADRRPGSEITPARLWSIEFSSSPTPPIDRPGGPGIAGSLQIPQRLAIDFALVPCRPDEPHFQRSMVGE